MYVDVDVCLQYLQLTETYIRVLAFHPLSYSIESLKKTPRHIYPSKVCIRPAEIAETKPFLSQGSPITICTRGCMCQPPIRPPIFPIFHNPPLFILLCTRPIVVPPSLTTASAFFFSFPSRIMI